MSDFFMDHTCEEYTYHFVWCCYAIAWGISEYDKYVKEQLDSAIIESIK